MLRINIAFRVPKEVENEALRIAASLAKTKDSFFFLDGITALPHISLYAPVVSEKNVDEVLQVVEEKAKEIEQLYVTLKEIAEGQGFITLEFGLTPDIKKAQDAIVRAVEPFREKVVEEKFVGGVDYAMNLSQGSLQSIEKYGSVGIVNYHPHITLLQVIDPIDAKLTKRKVLWSIPRFLVSKIGVFAMGDHGVCTELIEEFPLKIL